jgi:hypothetical protein
MRPWLPLVLAFAVFAGLCLTVLTLLPGGPPPLPGPAAVSYADPDPSSGVWSAYAQTTAASALGYAGPREVTIRRTGTAALLATVSPPSPYQTFAFVAGTGEPDRWIVGAQRWRPIRLGNRARLDNSAQPVTLFLLSYRPASGRVTAARLPAPPMLASELITDGSPLAVAGSARAGQLAAVTLSADGRRLALLTTTAAGYQVHVYPVGTPTAASPTTASLTTASSAPASPSTASPATASTSTASTAAADGTVRTWTERSAAGADPAIWAFSLTWLGDNQTLAIGITDRGTATAIRGHSSVLWLDTAHPAGDLATAGKTVPLTFPAPTSAPTLGGRHTPNGCTGAPVPASDGRTVLCSGTAAFPVIMAGATSVGIWIFAARTGKLTDAWNQHTICCLLSSTDFPDILWVSSHGDSLIAAGMTTKNQGAQLFLRAPNGRLRQLPWPGLFRYPGVRDVSEPSTAW